MPTLRFVTNHEILARKVFFTTPFHPLVTLMHLRVKKRHFMQFCRSPIKYSGAPLCSVVRRRGANRNPKFRNSESPNYDSIFGPATATLVGQFRQTKLPSNFFFFRKQVNLMLS